MVESTALIKKKSPVVDKLNAFFSSEYAVGVLAFFALCSALCGFELFFYSLICLSGIYLCLFGIDFRFFVPAAIYACVAISEENNPNKNPNSVLFPQNGMWVVIVLAAVLALLFVWRISRLKGTIFQTKRKFLSGFLALGAAFLISCFATKEHIWYNLRYSAVLFLSLFAMYYLLTVLLDKKSMKKDYFAWVLFFLGLCTAAQLFDVYAGGKVIVDGRILRSNIFVGWGTYNNLGLMILLGVPGAFYLSVKRNRGFIFNLFGNFLYLCVLLSNSRTGMLMGAVVYFACMFFVLRERKNYRQNFAVFMAAFVILFSLLLFFNDFIMRLFQVVLEKNDSNGRGEIYARGVLQFLSSPIIGRGFFASDAYDWWTVAGENLLPPLYHNNFVQMMASCGLIGIFAYAYHRVQTVGFFVKAPTFEKTFIGIALGGFLLTNVLDCHFFLLGPGLFYSSYLALADMEGAGTGLLQRKCERGGKLY